MSSNPFMAIKIAGNIVDREVQLKLFEIHHHQLEKRREKILFISRSSSAFFVALAGAVTAAEDKISEHSVWIVMIGVLFFAVSACLKLYYDGRAYAEIAGVIGRLNAALGCFEPVSGGATDSIYPQRWNKATKVHPFQTVSHHCLLTIFVAIAVCVFMFQFTQGAEVVSPPSTQ